MENRFLQDYVQSSTRGFRIALLLGFFIYAMFGVLDYILFPEIKEKLWFIRLALVCPALVAIFFFSYFTPFIKFWHVTIALAVIIAGLGVIAMMYIAPPPFNFSTYACVILVLFYSYTVPRALFVWSSLTGWGLFLCYDIAAVWIMETPLKILINNNFYFIGANLVGMIACYLMEYSARQNYWLVQHLEKEKGNVNLINKDLQEKNLALAEAIENVKTLSGFIPICMHCKKIRDDEGYWNQLESYLLSHSDAQLSHCLCPECLKELYPDIYEEIIEPASLKDPSGKHRLVRDIAASTTRND